MKIQLSKNVIEWTNANWQELEIPMESVDYEVVDKLPFGSGAHAMTWKGKVLVRKGWIEPALSDLVLTDTLNPRHLWAVETLAFHEPWHVQQQRKTSWWKYLFGYVWGWLTHGGYKNIPEEKAAYAFEEELGYRFFLEVGQHIDGWSRHRSLV